LQIADIDLNIIGPLLALVEDIAKRSWNETSIVIAANSSSHCECFTTTCLSICEYSPVEALHCRIHHVFGNFVEYLLLLCVHVEHLVELKRPLLLFIIDVSFILILGDEKLSSALLFVQTYLENALLKPL
jgi:hypothetical protein